jgi:hypothetical protein
MNAKAPTAQSAPVTGLIWAAIAKLSGDTCDKTIIVSTPKMKSRRAMQGAQGALTTFLVSSSEDIINPPVSTFQALE